MDKGKMTVSFEVDPLVAQYLIALYELLEISPFEEQNIVSVADDGLISSILDLIRATFDEWGCFTGFDHSMREARRLVSAFEKYASEGRYQD